MENKSKPTDVESNFDIYAARRLFLREWTRTILALLVMCACLGALAYAATHGDPSGEYDALLKVWAVVSVPLVALTGFYSRGSKPSDKSDD